MGHLKDLFVTAHDDDHEDTQLGSRWRPRKIEPEFLCPLCTNVLDSPLIFQPCQHAVCRVCIKDKDRRMGARTSCPVANCRQPVTSYEKPQRLFLSLLRNLKLKCPHTQNGCTLVLSLGNLEDHDRACEYNPGNEKECERGCGLVLSQRLRNSGTHSCVQHLKRELDLAKAKLWRTNKNLEITQRELDVINEQRPSSVNNDNHNGTDSDSGPSQPKRTCTRPRLAVVTCIRKWGLTANQERDCFGDIMDLVRLYTGEARKFEESLPRHWDMKLGQFRHKIHMVLRVHTISLHVGLITWKKMAETETEGANVGAGTRVDGSGSGSTNATRSMDANVAAGMIFEVDNEFRVEIFLNSCHPTCGH